MLIHEPHDHDIVSGRGQGSRNHPGNIYLLEKVREYKDRYDSAKRDKKKVIAQEVANLIKERNPPGRFLSKQDIDDDTVMWLVQPYDDEKVVSKVQQIFRDIKKQIKQNRHNHKCSNSAGGKSTSILSHIPAMESLPSKAQNVNTTGQEMYTPIDTRSEQTILNCESYFKKFHNWQRGCSIYDHDHTHQASFDGTGSSTGAPMMSHDQVPQLNSFAYRMTESALRNSTSSTSSATTTETTTGTSYNERAYTNNDNAESFFSDETSSCTGGQFSSKRKRDDKRSSFRMNPSLRRSSLTLEDIEYMNDKNGYASEHMSSLTMFDINQDLRLIGLALIDFDERMVSTRSSSPNSDQESVHSLECDFDEIVELKQHLLQSSDNDLVQSKSCPPLFQNRSTSIAYKEELPASLRYHDIYEC